MLRPWATTDDGLELTMGVNHVRHSPARPLATLSPLPITREAESPVLRRGLLAQVGHFLLAKLLEPQLAAAGAARGPSRVGVSESVSLRRVRS